MVKHIILWTLKDDTDKENVKKGIKDVLRASVQVSA